LKTLTNKITLVTVRAFKNSKLAEKAVPVVSIPWVAEQFKNMIKERRTQSVIIVTKTTGPMFPIIFAISLFNSDRSFAAAVKMLSKSNTCFGAQSNKALICLAYKHMQRSIKYLNSRKKKLILFK
jgi:hypothetical protein